MKEENTNKITVGEIAKTIREAETLNSLDELDLPTRTRNYLINTSFSLYEIIFKGRCFAYTLENYPEKIDKRKVSMLLLVDALDKAGFIRHDINATYFAICHLYCAIYKDTVAKMIPKNLEDLSMIYTENESGKIHFRDFCIGNERYENIKLTDDEIEDIKFLIGKKLTQKEYTVIVCRFGLDGDKPFTLEEIANILGVSRERVRQIEAKAIRKLKHIKSKLPKNMQSLEIRENKVVKIIEELEEIKKKEMKLVSKLQDISKLPFEDADEALAYFECGGCKNHKHFKIEQLDLSVRTYNCLKRAGLNTVGDIIEYPKEDWPKVRNLGYHCRQEIEDKIHAIGYTDFFLPKNLS